MDKKTIATTAGEQAEPAIQGKTISGWYVAWCETSGKLKEAKACIGRYQKLVSDLEELSKPRQSVPDSIIHLIQDYGDARADDDRYAASKFGDAITAIRRLIASQAAPAAPEQVRALTDDQIDTVIIKSGMMDKAWPSQVALHAFAREIVQLAAPSAAAPAASSNNPEIPEGCAAPAAPEQWISTTERMPEDGETVRILCPNPTPEAWDAKWNAGSQTFESKANGWVRGDEVSHWMPKPAATEQDAKDAARYRWLRDRENNLDAVADGDTMLFGERLDHTIDIEIAAQKSLQTGSANTQDGGAA